MTRQGRHWSAENHFAVAATLSSCLETLFVCWLRWCLLSPRWDHPAFSPPPSQPLCPSPLLEWLGPPHRGVEFNKGSLSHMLKRYANVQVLLFSDVSPPSTHPSSNWLLFSPSQTQTHGGRVCVCVCVWEREREFGCLFFRGMDYFVRTALGYLIWKAITMIAIRINYIMSYRNCERGTWRASLWRRGITNTHARARVQ